VQDYGELRLTGGGLGWVKRAAQQFPKADDSGTGQLALLEESPVASWSKATVVEKAVAAVPGRFEDRGGPMEGVRWSARMTDVVSRTGGSRPLSIKAFPFRVSPSFVSWRYHSTGSRSARLQVGI
jgi:hypothetical protein